MYIDIYRFKFRAIAQYVYFSYIYFGQPTYILPRGQSRVGDL